MKTSLIWEKKPKLEFSDWKWQAKYQAELVFKVINIDISCEILNYNNQKKILQASRKKENDTLQRKSHFHYISQKIHYKYDLSGEIIQGYSLVNMNIKSEQCSQDRRKQNTRNPVSNRCNKNIIYEIIIPNFALGVGCYLINQITKLGLPRSFLS